MTDTPNINATRHPSSHNAVEGGGGVQPITELLVVVHHPLTTVRDFPDEAPVR